MLGFRTIEATFLGDWSMQLRTAQKEYHEGLSAVAVVVAGRDFPSVPPASPARLDLLTSQI